SEEHTSELQSRFDLVCRLLLEKKKLGRVRGNWPRLKCRCERFALQSHSRCASSVTHRRASERAMRTPLSAASFPIRSSFLTLAIRKSQFENHSLIMSMLPFM